MSLEIINRAALGSLVPLGTLYDARTDQFYTGISVFKGDIPDGARAIVSANDTNMEFLHSDRISDKFSRLNICAELQVSILMGLINLAGSGNYISNKKQSARSVRSSLIYNIRTKNEILNVFHEDLKSVYSLDALGLAVQSTHFVSEIKWGANSMLMCEYENEEGRDEVEVGGKLSAELNKAKVAIKGEARVNFTSGDNAKSSSIKFRIFGDILPDGEIPTSIEAAVNLMQQIPRLISGSSGGKGKPISYTLLPISTLTKYLQLDLAGANLVRQISSSTLARVVQFFEAVEAADQLLFDYADRIFRLVAVTFRAL